VVAFHASRPGHDVPADLVRVNHAIGTNHEVVTGQYRDVIERCYGRLARCISLPDIGRFASANHPPRSMPIQAFYFVLAGLEHRRNKSNYGRVGVSARSAMGNPDT
jgi:hypothetical protein